MKNPLASYFRSKGRKSLRCRLNFRLNSLVIGLTPLAKTDVFTRLFMSHFTEKSVIKPGEKSIVHQLSEPFALPFSHWGTWSQRLPRFVSFNGLVGGFILQAFLNHAFCL